jgi:hypothetical protein
VVIDVGFLTSRMSKSNKSQMSLESSLRRRRKAKLVIKLFSRLSVAELVRFWHAFSASRPISSSV